MEPRQLIRLAFQVSVACTVFGFGLQATTEDLLYLVRRPGLLVRSLLAVFVVMPVVAVGLGLMFDLQPTARITLVALAISPIPPRLPKMQRKAGGHAGYGLGLMAIAAALSIVAIPGALELLNVIFERSFAMAPAAIAVVVLKFVFGPFAAGLAFRALAPAVAERIEGPVLSVSQILLVLALLVLLAASLPVIRAAVGGGTVAAMVLFSLAGLAVGHVLGGPDPDHSVVLALSTSFRNPAIAFIVASANFPNERFGGTILLYVLVTLVAGISYLLWRR